MGVKKASWWPPQRCKRHIPLLLKLATHTFKYIVFSLVIWPTDFYVDFGLVMLGKSIPQLQGPVHGVISWIHIWNENMDALACFQSKTKSNAILYNNRHTQNSWIFNSLIIQCVIDFLQIGFNTDYLMICFKLMRHLRISNINLETDFYSFKFPCMLPIVKYNGRYNFVN